MSWRLPIGWTRSYFLPPASHAFPTRSCPPSNVPFFTTGMPSLKDLIQNDESVTRKMTVALYSTCPDMRTVVHGAEKKKKTWRRSREDSLSSSENEKGNSGRACSGMGPVHAHQQHPELVQTAVQSQVSCAKLEEDKSLPWTSQFVLQKQASFSRKGWWNMLLGLKYAFQPRGYEERRVTLGRAQLKNPTSYLCA